MPPALESPLPPPGDIPYTQLAAWAYPFLTLEMPGRQRATRERGAFEVHRLVQTLHLPFASWVNLGNLGSISEGLSAHL